MPKYTVTIMGRIPETVEVEALNAGIAEKMALDELIDCLEFRVEEEQVPAAPLSNGRKRGEA